MPTEPVLKPERVRADDVAVDAPEPPLVDRPEAVDEKVVADVVPAVPLHVEELDPLHDRGCLRARVAVAARPCDGRSRSARRPRRSAGRAGSTRPRPTTSAARSAASRSSCGHAQRDERLRAPDEMRANPRHVPDSARLKPIGRPDPPRVPDPPAAPRVAPASPRRARPRPRAHPAATGSSARRPSVSESDRSRSAPLDAGEREARQRRRRLERALAGRRELDRRDAARSRRERRGSGDERGESDGDEGEEAAHESPG